MTQNELTISEVLVYPLIRVMMHADRVSVSEMEAVLVEAALKQSNPNRRDESKHICGCSPQQRSSASISRF